MKYRKFEILQVKQVPGGAGPEREWAIDYRAIENKQWKQDTLWVIAKNKQQACEKAQTRFGGKN